MHHRIAFLAPLLVLTLAATASAETKSYAAIKTKLPGPTAVVVGIDIKAARAAAAFPKLLEAAIAESSDVKQALELVKSICNIDPIASLSDATIVADLDDKIVVVLGLDGIDEAKISGCVNKIIQKSDPKGKLTAKPGKVTEYSMTGEKQKLYAAWLAKDVVAFSSNAERREVLDAVIAGKPATGDLAAMVARTNVNAFAFAAAALNKEGVKGLLGSLQLAKGQLALAAKVVAVDAKTGGTLLADGKKELAELIKRTDNKSPMVKVLKAIKVGGNGAELSIDLALPEADLPALIPAFGKLLQ